MFKRTVAKHGKQPAMALKRPVNGVIPADWKFWSWQGTFASILQHMLLLPSLASLTSRLFPLFSSLHNPVLYPYLITNTCIYININIMLIHT